MQDDQGAATRNTSLFQLDQHPFQDYIEHLINTGLLDDSDITYDLALFLDSLNIWVASNNLMVGNRKAARSILSSIRYCELSKRKMITLVRSYTPKYIYSILRRLYTVFLKFRLRIN